MRYSTVKYITIYHILNVILCTALDISPKLDFDNTQTSSKLTEILNTHKSPSYIGYKNENARTNEEFANIGVVNLCTENCKDTQSNVSKDSIQTDVVVHIKTNVDLNSHNKSIVVDDSPDIPVIVGSSDQGLNTNNNVFGSFRTVGTPHSHFQPNIQSRNMFKHTTNYPSIQQQVKVDNARKQNTVELHLPPLEPLYHTHYFGENPQQIIWYPKTHDYKLKPVGKPSYRTFETLPPTSQNYHSVPRTVCTCKESAPTDLQWYPSKVAYDVGSPGQVNDKLSPLD